jgi:Holliday junction resolvasome RuvABC endonuclease subunit
MSQNSAEINKIILGFDISSSVIGYGVLKLSNNKIIFDETNYIIPQKTSSIIDDLYKTKIIIENLIKKISPTHIAIEDIVKFMKGKSTANTIIKLTSFNRMVCLSSQDYLGYSPYLYNVMSIRHTIKKSLNLKKIPQKEELPNCLEYLLDIKYPFIINKNNNIDTKSYDMSDSLCCAYTCIIKNNMVKL